MRDARDNDGSACEEPSPTTGQRCGRPTSVWIIRFGERFNLCANCALRDYLR